MLRFKFLSIIFLIIFIFSSANLFSQTEENKHPYPIVICPIENCGYATYFIDSTQLPLFTYSSYMRFFHEKEIALDEWQSLEKHSDYIPINPNVKSISCPFENDFTEWSTSKDELKFHLGVHTTFKYNKKLSDEELEKLIK